MADSGGAAFFCPEGLAPMGIAICMISPITELIGPIVGVTPGASPSSMDVRRSETIWRARKMSVFQSNVT